MSAGCPGQRGGGVGWLLEGVGGGAKGSLHIVFRVSGLIERMSSCR